MSSRMRFARAFAPLLGAAAIALAAGCRAAPRTAPSPEGDAEQAAAGEGRGAAGEGREEVAVGYGTQPRDRITNSVGSVTTRDTDNQRVARVEELLRGRVAGVQVQRTPGGGYSIRIRGAGGLLSRGEPLFVLDGTPMVPGASLGQALLGLSPGDIARIDVLKDAGSTAIYGSQGGNGVVLITTKRRY